MPNVFAIPLFFIIFRETLETSIIVSVLLAFLKQSLASKDDPAVYKKLRRQVWYGTLLGLLLCLIIGSGVIGAFYSLQKNVWAPTEAIWEGAFALLASLIISIMGAALLRVSKIQEKWRLKLAKAVEAKRSVRDAEGGWRGKMRVGMQKYAMFLLPFVTVLREGLEAVVFAGGVSLGYPASAFALPVLTGLAAGAGVGVVIYKGGNRFPLQIFLIVSTCFLYLVAASLFSRAVWMFEIYKWNKSVGGDAAETGAGPGSYDIRQSVWHVNCCSPYVNGGGGWGIFNHLLGWQNSATYGSVISYNLYWVVVAFSFFAMGFREKRGRWPFMKAKEVEEKADAEGSEGSSSGDQRGSVAVTEVGKNEVGTAVRATGRSE